MRSVSQNGFTLIEIIVAMLIVGVLVLATGQLLVNMQGYLLKSQRTSNRMLSIYRLTDWVTDRSTVIQSLPLSPTNDKFRVCMAGGALGACTGNCCASGVPEEFVLLDSADSNPDLLLRRRLVGTDASPAFYSDEGELCGTGATGCFYKVTGTFSAQCPASAASCDKAELLVFNLRIQPTTADAKVKERTLSLHFTPNNNSKPTVVAIADQNLTVGQKIKVPVYANSGHPQERQEFLYSLCESSAPAIVSVTCFGFIDDVGRIVIEAVTAGSATIKIQVSDTGFDNNISDLLSFQTVVAP